MSPWRLILATTPATALALIALGTGSCTSGPSHGNQASGGAGGAATGTGGVFFFSVDSGWAAPPECDGSLPVAEAPDAMPPCDAGSPVSYLRDIVPIFNGCSGEICHQVPQYGSVVGKPSKECCGRFLIAPGDPSKSYLMDKIEGKNLCWGARMPLDELPLPASSIQLIADWICQGAPNN